MNETESRPETTNAPVAEQGAQGAPKGAAATKKASPKKKAAKAKTGAKKAAPAKQAAPQKTAKPKAAKKDATGARQGTKAAKVLDLIQRANGATIAEIQKATDWQPHTVRGFVSGTLTKKMGLKVESFKRENSDRAYRIAK